MDRTVLLRTLLAELDLWYHRFLRNDADVLTAWKELNVTLGHRVAVSGGGVKLEGLAHGVDAEGRLILKLDDGTLRQVAAGDVTIMKGKTLTQGTVQVNRSFFESLLVSPVTCRLISGGNMLLAIDIGNTNVVLGVFEGERLRRKLARRHQGIRSPPMNTR